MNTNEGIGVRLREERVRLGLTQTDFAALAGVGKNAQSNYEKDERSPDAAYLAAVATAGVDVLYVLTGQRLPASSGLSVQEDRILANFRALSEEDKTAVNRLTNSLAESAHPEVAPAKKSNG